MSEYEKFEGLVAGDGNPFWSQSYYWNVYDPVTRAGLFVRTSFLENQESANSWLIAFKDGQPLFNRINQTLPYTTERPGTGITIGGMRIETLEPLKKTRITFDQNDFSMDIVCDERNPLADVMALSKADTGSFTEAIAHVHLEGTCNVQGSFTHRGETTEINGTGFRDIGAGPRNWDLMKHYRFVWPVFEDGSALVAIHGFNIEGQSAYMRMYHDGENWCRVTDIDDGKTRYDHENFQILEADWSFTDEHGRGFAFEARPLFGWLFPVDTFVVREQIMEFRVNGEIAGYGMCEQGYRLPWHGIDR